MSALVALAPEGTTALPGSVKQRSTRDEIIALVEKHGEPMTVRDVLEQLAESSGQPHSKLATELRAALNRGNLKLGADLKVSSGTT